MAITNAGTVNSLHSGLIPSGYTLPVVTTFDDQEQIKTVELDILKATVENASKATTMANIIADAAIGITKQVDDMMAAEMLATATVDVYGDLVALRNNQAAHAQAGSDFLNDTAEKYIATVNIYIKSTP